MQWAQSSCWMLFVKVLMDWKTLVYICYIYGAVIVPEKVQQKDRFDDLLAENPSSARIESGRRSPNPEMVSQGPGRSTCGRGRWRELSASRSTWTSCSSRMMA